MQVCQVKSKQVCVVLLCLRFLILLFFIPADRNIFVGGVLCFVHSDNVGKPSVSSDEEEDEALETLKFNFNIESLGLVLYRNSPKQVGDHMRC